MVSKALLVLGFLLVAVVLISSEVAARELAENAEVEAKDPVNDAKQGGGGSYTPPQYPAPYGSYTPPQDPPPYGSYTPPQYPAPYCRICCYSHYCRCCGNNGEVPDLKAEAEPHN